MGDNAFPAGIEAHPVTRLEFPSSGGSLTECINTRVCSSSEATGVSQ